MSERKKYDPGLVESEKCSKKNEALGAEYQNIKNFLLNSEILNCL